MGGGVFRPGAEWGWEGRTLAAGLAALSLRDSALDKRPAAQTRA